MEKQSSTPERIKEYSIEAIRSSIKVYLSVLGPFGTAIDELLFGMGERIRGKRLEEFVELLSKNIELINIKKIDIEYFHSDDFYDLTVNTLNASVKTNSKIKHKILSEIFIQGINSKIKWEQDLTQTFIRYVNSLTPTHIIIFNYLSQHIETFKKIESYELLYDNFKAHNIIGLIDKYEFRMYLRDIENKSLLRFSRDINEFGSSGSYMVYEDYEEVQGITLTSIGEKFTKFLKNDFPEDQYI